MKGEHTLEPDLARRYHYSEEEEESSALGFVRCSLACLLMRTHTHLLQALRNEPKLPSVRLTFQCCESKLLKCNRIPPRTASCPSVIISCKTGNVTREGKAMLSENFHFLISMIIILILSFPMAHCSPLHKIFSPWHSINRIATYLCIRPQN